MSAPRRVRPGEGSRREDILEAAAQVFLERGFAAATTRDIGERAGLLSGSLYHHFESKEEMLFALVRDVYTGVLGYADELAGSDASGAELLRLAVGNHVLHLIANLERTTLFLHEFRSLSEVHREEIGAAEERYVSFVTGLIARGQRDGSLRDDLDPKLCRMVVLGAVNWLYRWYRADGPEPPAALAAHFAAQLLDGLASGSGG